MGGLDQASSFGLGGLGKVPCLENIFTVIYDCLRIKILRENRVVVVRSGVGVWALGGGFCTMAAL